MLEVVMIKSITFNDVNVMVDILKTLYTTSIWINFMLQMFYPRKFTI